MVRLCSYPEEEAEEEQEVSYPRVDKGERLRSVQGQLPVHGHPGAVSRSTPEHRVKTTQRSSHTPGISDHRQNQRLGKSRGNREGVGVAEGCCPKKGRVSCDAVPAMLVEPRTVLPEHESGYTQTPPSGPIMLKALEAPENCLFFSLTPQLCPGGTPDKKEKKRL